MHCGYNFALFALLWIGSDHFRHLRKGRRTENGIVKDYGKCT